MSSLSEQENLKVKSLAKAMKLLECFTVEKPVWGVSRLAEELHCSKSNVHNIISTFCDMGYLQKEPNGEYSLGLKLLEYAFIINQHLGYPKAIHDVLTDMADKTDQIIYFGVPFKQNVLYLYVVHPAARMNEFPYREIMGEKTLMCVTGIGKAMLANLPEETWDELIPDPVPSFTSQTITDRNVIKEDLKATRERGYSIDNRQREEHVRCVGVPVYNTHGKLVAGMSASGPDSIMTDEALLKYKDVLLSGAAVMKNRIYR